MVRGVSWRKDTYKHQGQVEGFLINISKPSVILGGQRYAMYAPMSC